MRVLGFKRLPLGAILAFLALYPAGIQGQLRSVVSNEIGVSPGEASLKIGFEDQGELTISFQDGRVLVDGEAIGSYERRDALDSAWRSLLSEVITLDDGPLATALNDWDPPRELTGPAADLAARIDQFLESSLEPREPSQPATNQGEITVSIGGEEGLLSALLSRTGALSGLAEALEGAPLSDFVLKIGEDVEVGEGEELEGSLVLVDGNLRVQGLIDGDVVVTGGTVSLMEGGQISGDLRIADGTLEDMGGSVDGALIDLDTGDLIRRDQEDREGLRRELESEIRREYQAEMEKERRRSPNLFIGFMGNVGSAIAGLLENLVTFLILAILGVLAVHFQRERLEIVATTAYRAPVRSGVVGLAGGFFIAPVWIVGIIALAITIIGIPVLLAWVPLFPIAAGLAILFGYLAVARNVGEWVSEQEYRGLEWIRGSNMFYTVVAGVGALMLPQIAANISRILGFGLLTNLLGFAGSMVTFIAGAVGLGAVLLTRGGKIRPLESYYDFEEEYWADVDPAQPAGPESEGGASAEPSGETVGESWEGDPAAGASDSEESQQEGEAPEEDDHA
ncbi:MAG: YccF domain-containing protein [Gemmatimonadetes bacterium]|nr:YccF domain-containing protein [Gemmatimonadota bacterium]NNM05633.1 YccF domain-containing protein [Gemmatimonadota bacterium]